MRRTLLLATIAVALSAHLSALSIPGTCIADMRCSFRTGVVGTYKPLGTLDVSCGPTCTPPDAFCYASGQAKIGAFIFPSGRMSAGCGQQNQLVPAGTTDVVFQVRCSDCEGSQAPWDPPEFPPN